MLPFRRARERPRIVCDVDEKLASPRKYFAMKIGECVFKANRNCERYCAVFGGHRKQRRLFSGNPACRNPEDRLQKARNGGRGGQRDIFAERNEMCFGVKLLDFAVLAEQKSNVGMSARAHGGRRDGVRSSDNKRQGDASDIRKQRIFFGRIFVIKHGIGERVVQNAFAPDNHVGVFGACGKVGEHLVCQPLGTADSDAVIARNPRVDILLHEDCGQRFFGRGVLALLYVYLSVKKRKREQKDGADCGRTHGLRDFCLQNNFACDCGNEREQKRNAVSSRDVGDLGEGCPRKCGHRQRAPRICQKAEVGLEPFPRCPEQCKKNGGKCRIFSQKTVCAEKKEPEKAADDCRSERTCAEGEDCKIAVKPEPKTRQCVNGARLDCKAKKTLSVRRCALCRYI